MLKSTGYNAGLEFVDVAVGVAFGLENPFGCDGVAVWRALSDCPCVVFEDGVDFVLNCLAPAFLLNSGGVASRLIDQFGTQRPEIT